MKFSPKTIGFVVLGFSAFTVLGCADVAPLQLDESMCSVDDEGRERCSLLLEEALPGEAYLAAMDMSSAEMYVVIAEDEPEFELHQALPDPGPSDEYLQYTLVNPDSVSNDIDTFAATPFFPETSRLQGPCPPVAVDAEGYEVCLEEVIVIELPNDRAAYECVYGECE